MPYFSDPLFQFQGYLSGLAPAGSQPLDARSPVLRIEKIWDDYRGQGVVVGVPGVVDRLNPDLAANYDVSSLASFDPQPFVAGNPEAAALSTFWAGIVAADDNGVGLVGVAPDAKIQSFLGAPPSSADIVLAISPTSRTDTDISAYSGTTTARDGLGQIVISNNPIGDTSWGLLGTDFPTGELNTDFKLNNERSIISVSALSAYGKQVPSSVSGDMTLVSAPIFTDASSTNFFEDVSPTIGLDASGNLGTSDSGSSLGFWELLAETQTGVDIDAAEYWVDISGIAANAVTSGVVALMLDANPDLGWRDVQKILAYSATFTDRQTGDVSSRGFPWDINGADDWNGGGLHFSAPFGFGAIDVFGAVRLAETWIGSKTSGNEASLAAIPQTPVPSGTVQVQGSFDFDFLAPGDLTIEHVALTFDFSAPQGFLSYEADEFIIEIVSPNGTSSILASPARVFASLPVTRFTETVTTRKFWGEETGDGNGQWQVRFKTGSTFDTIPTQFFDVSLEFFGDANVDDDVYIYTDEFDDLAGLGYSKLIDDDIGRDTVNAAAVTDDLKLVAAAGSKAEAGGKTLYRLSSDTEMYRLIAGDGNDTLLGSATANHLIGGRGSDRLDGRQGFDLIEGGRGHDSANGNRGNDTLYGSLGNDQLSGNDGNDTLFGGKGSDILSGGKGNDTLRGGEGNDTLSGGRDNDTLFGGEGNDNLAGNRGNDVLTGGRGSDTFVFAPGTGQDRIKDFGNGNDVIDISAFSGFANLADVRAAATNFSDGVTIDLGNSDSLIVEGFDRGDLVAGDFIF